MRIKYTKPLERKKRAKTYIEEVANYKLTHTSFRGLVELCNFLSKASETVRLESAVELKLLYLLALQASLRKMESNKPDETWLNEHYGEIYSQDSQWFVKKSVYQELYDKYRGLPIAERILQKMPD